MYIGKGMHIIGKCVITKSKDIRPKHMGKTVCNEKNRKIGRIIDIFGSVKEPHVKILIKKKNKNILGEKLFIR
ncbi:MAG: hypothetical protein U9N35_07665 [Euryarchaeota archaeon]|nr:hypothetical protein [Euryarchaeota archaeon]